MRIKFYKEHNQLTLIPTLGITWNRHFYKFGIVFQWLKFGFGFYFDY